jgi:glycosyltransferase involved in cell wall biosynthesis
MFSLHVDTSRDWRREQGQVLLTVLGLRSAGHRAELVAHPDSPLGRHAREGLQPLPLTSHTEADFAAGWRLSRVVRRLAPEVIHAHDPHAVAVAALALSLDAKGPQPPLVAARRGDAPIKQNAFSRWKYRQVDRFVCSSETVRRALVAAGIEDGRTVVVHDGLDLAHVDAAPRADVHVEFWLPHRAPVVGAVGPLVAHKAYHDLVDAIAILRRHLPDVHLVIVGEGELRASVERQVRHLRLEKHVVLAGGRPDALSLLKGFDVVATSSHSEGSAAVLLDAMASARPIVATRVGAIPEVVADGETGLLVEARAPDALASALARVLGQPDLARALGAAGRRRVEREFSAERMVRETLAVYARLAGRPHAGDTAHPVAAG